jgi:hypothetical protein
MATQVQTPPAQSEKPNRKKCNGKPFVPGDPRIAKRKGVPNKVTFEVKALSKRLLEDPIYQAKFLEDWQARKIHPRIEEMIWSYRYGKPRENIKVEVPALSALAGVPKPALLAIARALLAAEEESKAIPTEATVIQ